MSEENFNLKLQASLDGELSPREARKVEKRLTQDEQARNLAAELQGTRRLLQGNELVRKCPESREFYWSKIEKQILQSQRQKSRPAPFQWLAWIRHHFVTAGGMAVATAVLVFLTFQFGDFGSASSSREFGLTKSPTAGVNSIYFRNDSSQTTLIWLTQAD